MRRVAIFSLLVLAAVAAAAKDLRTAMIRLVPETDWKPAAGQSVAVVVDNAATAEKAGEFAQAFDKWLRESLPRLKYPIDEAAGTRIHVTLEEVDLGNAALRFAVGFGAGKSYVRGRMVVEQGGKPVGVFTFTGRPRSPSPEAMARELAPAVALKLHNGERDGELHEPNEKAAESKAGEG
jgi:hypothetical protein